MMIKSKHVSKSVLSVILATCMLLSCVYVGLIPTDAAIVESDSVGSYNVSAKIYVEKPSDWTNVTVIVGKGDYSTAYLMSNISGTNLYYRNVSWDGATEVAFMDCNWGDSSGESNKISNRWSGVTNRTPVIGESTWKFESGNTYRVTIASNSTNSTPSMTYYSGGYSDLNKTLTIKTMIKSGSTFSETSTKYGTFSASGAKKLDGNGSSTTSSVSQTNGTGTLTTVRTNTATISQSPNSGYTFAGWKTTADAYGSGLTTGSYSFTNSGNDATVYAYYQRTETTYSVQVQSEDTSKGTVASSTVSAGSTAVTIPTATPKYGYKFKQWVATSPATIAANATNASTGTVTATGTGGKVTAQFEPDTSMNLYIAGRFHVRESEGSSTWVNSFASGADWSDTGAGNIKFTYDSGTTYKVETYASVAELSTNISNYEPYFFVYDSDNSYGWHPTASLHLKSSTTSGTLSTNTNTYNARFDDTSDTDTPVTIYFDVVSKELSYDVPNYYTITCNTATGGTVTANVEKQKEGQTVTLTLSPSNGYTVGTVTVTKAGGGTVTVSGSGNTRTFTMPAEAVTVTATFTETKRTVTVYKRYTKQDGTVTTDTTATQTITNVGVATTATVSAAGTVANYTFSTFTVPSTVTVKTGSASTSASFTITATANATIYIDYTETLYTLTLVNQDDHGTIKKSGTSTAITSIQVGNVTGVTLVATPNNGYQFAGWEKTTNATAITVGSTSSATTTFKINANATVTAKYTAVAYTISATGSPAAGATTLLTTDTSGNSKTGGTINELFEIRITVNTAAGYALADNPITFQTGTGYAAPTLQSGYPTTSGNTVTYRYKLNAGSAVATVNFKAATPTISGVRMRDTTHLATAIDSCTSYSNNATVNTYYKQPVYAKAVSSDVFTSTYSYATKTTGGAALGSSTETPCDIAASTSIIPTTEDGYAEYKFSVTATNAPSGVTAATTTYNYTIRVSFNATQKWYFRLNQLYSRCIEESVSNNPYYKDGAPLNTYNTAYNAAKSFINAGYPAYDATAANATAAQSTYNTFKTAYDNLMTYAKTTTVYVLTKYANSASYPMYFHVSSNGSTADWNHFKMYSYGDDEKTNDTYKMTFAGTFVYGSTNRYLYSFTFAGHMKFNVWRGTSASDLTMDNIDKLTGDISNVTEFKDYYVNVYNTTVGSTSVTSASAYVDFDHTIATGKKFIEIGQAQTGAQIKTLFNITPVGSVVSAPGIDNLATTNNTAFTIEGPIDKGIHTVVNLKTTSFPAATQGRYTVKYTTKFGTDASGTAITRTKEMTLYVAFDDVTIYVDMNDNVGNPILNFKYKQKNEVPVSSTTSGATDAYLPYEMDLVTGSESIYKYTVKTSKLKSDYFLNFDANNPLNICYITVERTNYSGTNNAGFDILSEARITGEIWFKADSSHLTTFQTISCGSVTKSFVAATTEGAILSSAVDTLHGTGINTDVDEVYKAQYAGLYTLDGDTAPMNNFHYVLNASVKREVQSGNNTYYFDKWVCASDANVTYTYNAEETPISVAYTNGTDAGTTAGLAFTAAAEYGDGDQDVTYIAVYKLVGSSQPMRVEITYKFQDYDTSDGNYIYDENKETVDASYTKTVNTTYTSVGAVASHLAELVQSEMPYIKSNYFDYSFGSVDESSIVNDNTTRKTTVNVNLTHTPHRYRIILKNGSNIVSNTTGYYQQPVELASGGYANPVWKDSSGNILGSGTSGSTFTARYVSSGNEKDGSADCQIIKVENGSSTAADHKSVISNSYTEVYYTESGVEMLSHNFYIIDYCTEGELLGGGVLFATTDGTNYRQSNAATQLASATSRKNFITGILNGDFETEYKAQTINNVGFRYKPFKSTEDVFRYSDDLKGYITIYEGSNVNSDAYDGQTLRVFSFMVYSNGGNAVIVPSDGYAEVSRYQQQPQS